MTRGYKERGLGKPICYVRTKGYGLHSSKIKALVLQHRTEPTYGTKPGPFDWVSHTGMYTDPEQNHHNSSSLASRPYIVRIKD